MKNLNFFLSLLTFTMLLFLTSCGNKPDLAETGLEYTGAYVCPMHCKGSGSETMGKCPVCKMDYVALGEHKADGHQHKKEPKVENHNHDSHDGHNHDHGSHEGHEH